MKSYIKLGGVLVSEDATCKGKLGNLMEVTLMARLSRQTARGRVALKKIEYIASVERMLG